MFFVDKYYNTYNELLYNRNDNLLKTIIDSFDEHIKIYNNFNNILTLPNDKLKKVFYELDYKKTRFSNFQHLIIYGPPGSNKEYIVNKLLENIYGKEEIELKDIEYTISGYSNTNVKIIIKQSKNHIIIEPNSNGFDKYLIQEIIQNYAKSKILNIINQTKMFKIIIINKIYNLSYYAQASLRRTMEKYSNICKFILITDQLSKIINPLISRCLIIRIPLATNEEIFENLLYVSLKENLKISYKNLNNIINKSDNNISHSLWLFEMYKYNYNYNYNWENIIDIILSLIININKKNIFTILKKIRENFYILFITNISSQLIIKKIMIKLLKYIDTIKKSTLELKYNIINISSIYNERLILGTRHIIHIEAYIIKLIHIIHKL
jgi:replication factor C subunit 3/5